MLSRQGVGSLSVEIPALLAPAKSPYCTFASIVSVGNDVWHSHALRAVCWPNHSQYSCMQPCLRKVLFCLAISEHALGGAFAGVVIEQQWFVLALSPKIPSEGKETCLWTRKVPLNPVSFFWALQFPNLGVKLCKSKSLMPYIFIMNSQYLMYRPHLTVIQSECLELDQSISAFHKKLPEWTLVCTRV